MADNNTGTIDVTNTVESVRSIFVTWAVTIIYAAEMASPELAPVVGLPILSDLDRAFIKKVLDFLSKDAVMLAFFENTVIRKSGQATDFINAVKALDSLPTNVTEDEYEKAEDAKILAFRNFVLLTN